MLKIVGLWPQESKNQHEELLSKVQFLLNIIMLIFVLAIPALVSLIRVWGDMILMIDNLQYTLPLLITMLKVFIMWYKKEALSPLINMIVNDWIKVKMEEERIVMLKQAKIVRLLAVCGILMILSTMLITVLSFPFARTLRHVTNLTDPIGKPLPIQSYYLHDVSSSPKYELTYLIQTIALTTSGLSYTAVDSFLGLLILHVCGQIENLHLRLLNLGKDSNFKAVLKYNVKDHIRLNRSIETIDNTFNLMLLGLLFFFGILFCLHGFLIVSIVNRGGHLSILQLVWYTTATICVLMHMCLYCAVGELLVSQNPLIINKSFHNEINFSQSEKIHRATYEYVWYTLEPKAARNLTLIMLRTKKPLNITAGKTFPMTMSTFCNVSYIKHIKYAIVFFFILLELYETMILFEIIYKVILSKYNFDYTDLEWAISLNRCMLKIIGLWPKESKTRCKELLSKIRFLFNVIMLIFVLTIPALMSLIRVWGDMILMIDNLQYTLPLLITMLKVFIMWYNKGALSPLIDMIVKDWIKVKMEEERIVMLKQAKITRSLAICGVLMILSTLVITFGSFLFGKTLRHVTNFTDPVGKHLPIQAYYPHDVSNSPNFELTYLIQVIGLTTSGLSYTAVDNFLGLLILHICGQMENLHLRLLNLGKNSHFKALLKHNVKDHIRLIRF
ncbi:OR13A protein, partial [Acromyrmex heyeri]